MCRKQRKCITDTILPKMDENEALIYNKTKALVLNNVWYTQ